MKPVNTWSFLLQGNAMLRTQKSQMPSSSIIKEYTNGKDTKPKVKNGLSNRYRSITEELDLDEEIIEEIARDIKSLATLPKSDNTFLYDTFLAAGENNNAKLIAAYFVKKGYAEELKKAI